MSSEASEYPGGDGPSRHRAGAGARSWSSTSARERWLAAVTREAAECTGEDDEMPGEVRERLSRLALGNPFR